MFIGDIDANDVRILAILRKIKWTVTELILADLYIVHVEHLLLVGILGFYFSMVE